MSDHATGSFVDELQAWMLRFPTPEEESDGTFHWDHVSVLLVEVRSGAKRGFGWSYTSSAAGSVVDQQLKPVVEGTSVDDISGTWHRMFDSLRNIGNTGVAMAALSAVDVALWDLKARVLDLPLVSLLGAVRDGVPVYGSGGFTSYPPEQVAEQLGGWASDGFSMVKMKVGRDTSSDVERLTAAREAIGGDVQLFVDANGAYDVGTAVEMAEVFGGFDVSWFEEPVSSDDLAGLQFVRSRRPMRMRVAAGEYGYRAWYFDQMLHAGAVDVLQADASRCGGITGFLQVDALCWATNMALSGHTCPTIHTTVCSAAQRAVHFEYFVDHARIEAALFDGIPSPQHGVMRPRLDEAGLGIEPKWTDLDAFDLTQVA